MGNVFAVISTFTLELPVFLKEHESGMYRSDVYYICKTVVDIPVFILLPFLLVTIGYWMAAMNPAWEAYLIACCVLALVANTAVSFGYIFSCACSSTQTAIATGRCFFLSVDKILMQYLRQGGIRLYLRILVLAEVKNFGFFSFFDVRYDAIDAIDSLRRLVHQLADHSYLADLDCGKLTFSFQQYMCLFSFLFLGIFSPIVFPDFFSFSVFSVFPFSV